MRASIIHANEGGGIMRGATISSRVVRSSYGIVYIQTSRFLRNRADLSRKS
jgi:hypothetical protein